MRKVRKCRGLLAINVLLAADSLLMQENQTVPAKEERRWTLLARGRNMKPTNDSNSEQEKQP
jgi:hypothetical protein